MMKFIRTTSTKKIHWLTRFLRDFAYALDSRFPASMAQRMNHLKYRGEIRVHTVTSLPINDSSLIRVHSTEPY